MFLLILMLLFPTWLTMLNNMNHHSHFMLIAIVSKSYLHSLVLNISK
eukprot:UN08484